MFIWLNLRKDYYQKRKSQDKKITQRTEVLYGKHTAKTLDKFPKESTIDVDDNDPINIDEEILSR